MTSNKPTCVWRHQVRWIRDLLKTLKTKKNQKKQKNFKNKSETDQKKSEKHMSGALKLWYKNLESLSIK